MVVILSRGIGGARVDSDVVQALLLPHEPVRVQLRPGMLKRRPAVDEMNDPQLPAPLLRAQCRCDPRSDRRQRIEPHELRNRGLIAGMHSLKRCSRASLHAHA